MEKILVVVDMQNDFIDGSLGTEEARNIVEPVCEKNYRIWRTNFCNSRYSFR